MNHKPFSLGAKICLILSLFFSLSMAKSQEGEIMTGKLFMMIEDDFEAGVSRTTYEFIEQETSKSYQLKFPDDEVPEAIKKVRVPAKIKIKGIKHPEERSILFEKLEAVIPPEKK